MASGGKWRWKTVVESGDGGWWVAGGGGWWRKIENVSVTKRHLILKLREMKKLNEALLGPVDALLDGAGDDTWLVIRKLLRRETESTVFGLSTALSSFDMDEQTKGKMLKSLEDFARGIIESKAKEEAGRVLFHMKDR
ncbi:hypothetical protein HYC85_012433 [Camellia sinensis]|uniref:Sey1/RHD3-like three-helix bundle domain-containing protein n=1 Tax=Camellia sinensis TaxID=4442 RepID=A0A7J7HBX1_CAMSI|nr:hypothetical protein HYC85_012433 [Camellia sinensis]